VNRLLADRRVALTTPPCQIRLIWARLAHVGYGRLG
jgi:hypothetical protein